MKKLSIVFLSTILWLCVPANGQSPLKLKISPLNTCLGKDMRLNVEITNISNKTTTIDRAALWYMISFRHKGDSRTVVNESIGSEPVKSIVLLPKKRYKAFKSIDLVTSFFDEPDVYEVSVTYATFPSDNRRLWVGTLKSDYVAFRIEKCR